MSLKVLHVISSLRKDSGGPARSVQGLVGALEGIDGLSVHLFSFRPCDQPWFPGINHFSSPSKSGFLNAFRALKKTWDAFSPDLIHIHGIWGWKSHFTARIARWRRVPYIIAPRGMLEPWALNEKRIKKKIALFLYQRRDLFKAVALHATAPEEAEQFKKLGFQQACVMGPNGVNVPSALPARKPRKNNLYRMLFLSRIHPKKGLVELLDAWAEIIIKKLNNHKNNDEKKWVLEIAGTDSDGYLKIVEEKAKTLGLSCAWGNDSRQKHPQTSGIEHDLVFRGAFDDDTKWEAYRQADVFVLPTYSENFGIVVAEALYAGCPVITTHGTPWADLRGIEWQEKTDLSTLNSNDILHSGCCGWWIKLDKTSLVAALDEAMRMNEDAQIAMGKNGKFLIESKYLWPSIAKQIYNQYRDIYFQTKGA